MAAKKKKEIHVTPRCTFAYAWIHRPDEGQKYSNGKFKVTGVFDKKDPDVPAFVKAVKKFCPNKIEDGDKPINKKTGKPKEVKEEFKGKILITFASKFAPKVVDAKRKPLPEGVEARSGDVGKIAYSIREWEEGSYTLDLQAVQLLEKRNRGVDYSDAFDEEDGFTADGDDASGDEGAPGDDDELDF